MHQISLLFLVAAFRAGAGSEVDLKAKSEAKEGNRSSFTTRTPPSTPAPPIPAPSPAPAPPIPAPSPAPAPPIPAPPQSTPAEAPPSFPTAVLVTIAITSILILLIVIALLILYCRTAGGQQQTPPPSALCQPSAFQASPPPFRSTIIINLNACCHRNFARLQQASTGWTRSWNRTWIGPPVIDDAI